MNFIDLKEQYNRYKQEINRTVLDVLASGRFIMGPVLTEFENRLAAYIGVKNAICCASGTDALLLSLMALDIQPGDEIIVPDFTFIATAEVVCLLKAKPVFVDIDADTYNINSNLIQQKITHKTRGIIAVSLFGQCANFDKINKIARHNNLFVIEDAAQSLGAVYDNNKKSCNLTEIATTSFYPAKPLGCYGDGGAIFTNNSKYNEKIRILLDHGQHEKYKHKYIGINGRMDPLQAAILQIKLKHYDEECRLRTGIAQLYNDALQGLVKIPVIKPGNSSIWTQYTVRSKKREIIIKHLKKNNIPVAIHYPIPLHKQEAFSFLANKDSDFPITNTVCKEVFSLPMHPFLQKKDIHKVADCIKEALT